MSKLELCARWPDSDQHCLLSGMSWTQAQPGPHQSSHDADVGLALWVWCKRLGVDGLQLQPAAGAHIRIHQQDHHWQQGLHPAWSQQGEQKLQKQGPCVSCGMM